MAKYARNSMNSSHAVKWWVIIAALLLLAMVARGFLERSASAPATETATMSESPNLSIPEPGLVDSSSNDKWSAEANRDSDSKVPAEISSILIRYSNGKPASAVPVWILSVSDTRFTGYPMDSAWTILDVRTNGKLVYTDAGGALDISGSDPPVLVYASDGILDAIHEVEESQAVVTLARRTILGLRIVDQSGHPLRGVPVWLRVHSDERQIGHSAAVSRLSSLSDVHGLAVLDNMVDMFFYAEDIEFTVKGLYRDPPTLLIHASEQIWPTDIIVPNSTTIQINYRSDEHLSAVQGASVKARLVDGEVWFPGTRSKNLKYQLFPVQCGSSIEVALCAIDDSVVRTDVFNLPPLQVDHASVSFSVDSGLPLLRLQLNDGNPLDLRGCLISYSFHRDNLRAGGGVASAGASGEFAFLLPNEVWKARYERQQYVIRLSARDEVGGEWTAEVDLYDSALSMELCVTPPWVRAAR